MDSMTRCVNHCLCFSHFGLRNRSLFQETFPLLLVIFLFSTIQPCLAQYNEHIGFLLEAENKVEISFNNRPWEPARVGIKINPGDQIRTGHNSRALVQSTDQSFTRMGELTTIRFRDKDAQSGKSSNKLIEGILYFFSRHSNPDRTFSTDLITAAVKGTEFVLSTDSNGMGSFSLIDGEAQISSKNSETGLFSGQQVKINSSGSLSVVSKSNLWDQVEWCLYYPTVLVIEELGIISPVNSHFHKALEAYKIGDFRTAIEFLDQPDSHNPGEGLFRATLCLATGQADRAIHWLKKDEGFYQDQSTGISLLMQVITNSPLKAEIAPPTTATGLLGQSYYYQSQGKLKEALAAVHSAAQVLSKENGLIWFRQGELNFNLGRYQAARDCTQSALLLIPQSAAVHSLLGFLYAVSNQDDLAEAQFLHSISLDSGFPDARLGLALIQFRKGDFHGGTVNLETAVALSPRRASLRNYLTRFFLEQELWDLANTESEIAQSLYSDLANTHLIDAFVKASHRDRAGSLVSLRNSIRSNDLRSPLRSTPLLIEDEAIRKSNLARFFDESNLSVFAQREASRAIQIDPGGYSAHQFLSQSLHGLLDPTGSNLRYQTPWQSERLAYDIGSPAQAGLLPLPVSQNNYHQLLHYPENSTQIDFSAFLNRGFNASVDYRSNGKKFSGSLGLLTQQFSNFGDDIEFYQTTVESGLKYDLSPGSTVTTIGRFNWRENRSTPFFNTGIPDQTKIDESFPSLLLAWRKSWSPDSFSIIFGQWSSHDQSSQSKGSALVTNSTGSQIIGILDGNISSSNESQTFQLEWQHYQNFQYFGYLGGLRSQWGIWNSDFQISSSNYIPIFTSHDSDFNRLEAYIYGFLSPIETATFTLGINATRFEYPENVFTLPPSQGIYTKKKILPKVGYFWQPNENWMFRAAYTESMGGLALEDGYRMEPTQVAGFLQGYRALLAENLDGTHPALHFNIYGVGLSYSSDNLIFFDLEYVSRDSTSNRGLGHFRDNSGLIPSNWPTFTEFSESTISMTIAKIFFNNTTSSLNLNTSNAYVNATIPEITQTAFREGDLVQVSLKFNQQFDNGIQLFVNSSFSYQEILSLSSQKPSVSSSLQTTNSQIWNIDLGTTWKSKKGSLLLELGLLNLLDESDSIDSINWIEPQFFGRTLYLKSHLKF